MIDKTIEFLTFGLTNAQLKLLRDFTWRAIVTFHIIYACGWLAFIGLPYAGFAAESELKTLVSELQQDRADRLESEILINRRLQCRAESPEVRSTYSTRIQELQSKYRQLTNQYARVPACDEV